ncbi:hypothetical protein EUBSIR_02228 [[Eubacterium] siraeum DSM 15702]|uniref:Uncharacterized protein n=1 Tax=[Eubacterium] siraeum DSM 15702 TaxID=428128 RepID=B0MQW1_9FIRM|nr:hypothetical protein EUBSIR_02228 [[Eubacterium] siraeum DSM 15702]
MGIGIENLLYFYKTDFFYRLKLCNGVQSFLQCAYSAFSL